MKLRPSPNAMLRRLPNRKAIWSPRGLAVRAHWGLENSLHWVLDVAFREDDSRVRTGNAAENLALIRKITHNLMQQKKTDKRGVKSKRLRAGWDEKYLLTILNANPNAP